MAMAEDEDVPPNLGSVPATQPDAGPRSKGGVRGVNDEPVGDLHTYIGSRLRQAFDDIASQPVPDRFLQLMQELDKA